MINHYLDDPIARGVAQALAATVLALLVVLLARRQAVYLGRETSVALVRGGVQIVAVGAVLALLLSGPAITSALILLAMMLAAATIAARRGRGMPGAWWASFCGIAGGAGGVIALMTALGVIEPTIASVVPVGSMIIANAMNSNALALERFRADVGAHRQLIEAGLALGAAPTTVVSPYVQTAVQASLIPRIDSLSSLGIVWIPGLMAGMILAGADPLYAAIYQFVTLTMIYAAAGITALVTTLLIRSRVFSPAEQLLVGL